MEGGVLLLIETTPLHHPLRENGRSVSSVVSLSSPESQKEQFGDSSPLNTL